MVQVLNLLKGSDTPAKDQEMFLKAQLLFWLMGATDGHAKNFSIFLGPGGSFRLTPLYDVLTAQPSLDAHQIRRNQMKLAMSAGCNRHYRIDDIHGRHFIQTGEEAGLPKSLVRAAIEEVARMAIEPDAARRERHDVGHVLGDERHVVRDQDDRPSGAVQFVEQRHERLGVEAVLAKGGLVEDQNVGIGDERAGDREATLLAVTQGIRARLGQRRQVLGLPVPVRVAGIGRDLSAHREVRYAAALAGDRHATMAPAINWMKASSNCFCLASRRWLSMHSAALPDTLPEVISLNNCCAFAMD